MRKLEAGEAPLALELEILAAARTRGDDELAERARSYEKALSDKPPAERYRAALVGGDADRGASVFYDKAEVFCVRCHRIGNRGGRVGPDLSDLGKRQKRESILESIVDPSKTIAAGFETVVVVKKDGTVVTGISVGEGSADVTLLDGDGRRIVVPASDIAASDKHSASAMPQNLLDSLTTSEIRDLVEFLARQRTAPRP